MFDKAFNDLMPIEGGDKYTNNAGDYPTRFGITEPVARAFGYKGDMKDLPMDIAKQIYKQEYWDKMRLDDIAALSYDIAWQLFQCGVNQGIGTAVKMLQRALNLYYDRYIFSGAAMHMNKPIKNLVIDGILGNQTITNLNDVFKGNEQDTLLSLIKAQQIMRYMEIIENNKNQTVFLNGWIRRVGL